MGEVGQFRSDLLRLGGGQGMEVSGEMHANDDLASVVEDLRALVVAVARRIQRGQDWSSAAAVELQLIGSDVDARVVELFVEQVRDVCEYLADERPPRPWRALERVLLLYTEVLLRHRGHDLVDGSHLRDRDFTMLHRRLVEHAVFAGTGDPQRVVHAGLLFAAVRGLREAENCESENYAELLEQFDLLDREATRGTHVEGRDGALS